MPINGSEDAPFARTVRMTWEHKDFTNVVLPGYHPMNALSGTGHGEPLEFFPREKDRP